VTFKIACNWLEKAAKPTGDELEASLAALRIFIGDKNVTEYGQIVEGVRPRGDEALQDKLHIPAYFLAEWLSENWWPLLYEPRKTESSDDVDFYSRHSILQAQHGFALPNVQIEPLGEAIRVTSRPREAPIPGVRFRQSATTIEDRNVVHGVLKAFLKVCVDRLESCGIAETPLQRAWKDITQTTPEQSIFCSLVGALGVNPYGASAELSAVIDAIYDSAGSMATFDLCMASTESEILQIGKSVVDDLTSVLDGPHDSTLAPLANLRLRGDNKAYPSWARGKNAAINARKLLDIDTNDQLGPDKFFDALKISTETTLQTSEEMVFSGAVDRIGDSAKFLLLQEREEARRFAASRAVFLAISSESESRRLVTNAMTRDQQASRTFAAEMLVPSEYLRSRARGGKIARDDIHEIARRRRAAIDVVKYQATNIGLLTNTTF
jgi:hypothetical protein